MIKILNQQLQPVANLENAYSIGYEKSFNELWTATFCLPLNDPKKSECKSLYYVEVVDNDEYIGLFRIIPENTVKSESTNEIKYSCEHVLATLLDDVLFLYHQNDNLTTTDNIDYLLDKQTTKHWKRGQVAFTRYFSYKWENENGLLGPMLSVPKPFDVPYQWTHDTTSYPWTLNLVEPESDVTCEIRYGKNQISIEREVDPTTIVNRIYDLGYGEGDNQLTIKSVNNGLPYVEDAESIAKYGLRAYIWVDKRFEDAETLMANSLALLNKWKVPKVTYRAAAADISSITGEDIDKLKMGRIVRMIDDELGIFESRIVKESKSDIKGNPGGVQLEIANKTDDLSRTQSDIERRQQINELYSQGATNLLSYSYNDNCDQDNPAEIVFFLPDEMVRINKLTLWFEISNFRAYERAIKGGGATTATSSAGGGTSSTSSSGGGTSTTTSGGGSHRHLMLNFISEYGPELPDNFNNYLAVADSGGGSSAALFAPGYNGDLYTYGSSGAHSHDFSVPNHSHNFSIGNHQHDISIPEHTHDMDFGIFKLQNTPSAVTIKVDGNTVPGNSTSGENIDLIPYLSKDSEGKVNRGKHVISLTPNALGRINAQVNTQFFMQSRGGGSF